MQKKPPMVLCFSGHDATGGAGLQADIESLMSQGIQPCTVVTALTVQDSIGVSGIASPDPELMIDSARAVLEDIPVAAIKIGLLGGIEILEAVYSVVKDYPDVPLVFDPVLVSGDGTELAQQDLIDGIIDLMLPQTTVLTPNSIEARMLASDADTLNACAISLMEHGCEYVLLTGTHEASDDVVNALYHNQRQLDEYRWPRLPHSYHGSGCTMAATLSGLLAHGLDALSACREAQNYTWNALDAAYQPGMGQHFPQRLYWAETEEEMAKK